MITITDKSKCSGCHACYNACPKNCIEMKKDAEGFLYPIVDLEHCIRCGICEKVCQPINPIKAKSLPAAYACYSQNEKIRNQSSSGGVFTLLAEWIIKQGGAVFGAAFDKNFSVHHICIENTADLHKLRGSKYLQSTIGDTYKQAKNKLDRGQLILFTGTPCQIDGLLHYLKKDYENLYTQDLICHGVPSPKVWQIYLKYQEKKHNSTLSRESLPAFRHKANGWKRYSLSLSFDNNSEYRNTFDGDPYMKAFLSNLSLRPSCYNCQSKNLKRNSDITLADYWGVENVEPELFDDKGTSLIFVNSEKGNFLLKEIKDNLHIKETDVNKAVLYNSSAYKSVALPKNRKEFMKQISSDHFEEVTLCMVKPTLFQKIKFKLRAVIRKIIKGRT